MKSKKRDGVVIFDSKQKAGNFITLLFPIANGFRAIDSIASPLLLPLSLSSGNLKGSKWQGWAEGGFARRARRDRFLRRRRGWFLILEQPEVRQKSWMDYFRSRSSRSKPASANTKNLRHAPCQHPTQPLDSPGEGRIIFHVSRFTFHVSRFTFHSLRGDFRTALQRSLQTLSPSETFAYC